MGIEKVIIGGFVAAVAGLICLAVVASAAEQKQWDAFAATHDCKLVEHRKGDVLVTTATTIGANGKVSVTPMTTVTPDKRAFQCSDGVTYWR